MPLPSRSYGIARVDLHALLQGVRQIRLEASVLPGPRLSAGERTTGEDTGSAMLPGLYVEAGTFVEVSLSLAVPLGTAAAAGSSGVAAGLDASLLPNAYGGAERPFTRLVVLCANCDSSNAWVDTLRTHVSNINARACGLDSLDAGDRAAALET